MSSGEVADFMVEMSLMRVGSVTGTNLVEQTSGLFVLEVGERGHVVSNVVDLTDDFYFKSMLFATDTSRLVLGAG